MVAQVSFTRVLRWVSTVFTKITMSDDLNGVRMFEGYMVVVGMDQTHARTVRSSIFT